MASKPPALPKGFSQAVSRNWASRWYANNRDFAGMLAEDIKVREYISRKLKKAAVSRVIIERPAKNAKITIFSARPGVVIGNKGEDIEALKKELSKRLGVPVAVNIEEVRKPEIDAQLIADSITQQLEKRIMFRRAMKRAMQNAMRLGAQGIKIMSAGRLNGIEIDRTEWYREGRVPLHTLRADIDYGFSEAKTTYGFIGVKVWVYKGDSLARNPPVERKPREERARESIRIVRKRTRADGELRMVRPSLETPAASVVSTVANSPAIAPLRLRSISITDEESRRIMGGLPGWVQAQAISTPLALRTSIEAGSNKSSLVRALLAARPRPIQTGLDPTMLRSSGKQHAVIGLFPSGAVRTVGSLEIVPGGSARILPFSYLSLLDPDDAEMELRLERGYSSRVDVVVVEVI